MTYDPLLALQCADLSAQVYDDQPDRPDEKYFSINGTQVWVINEPDRVLVVYRGTSYEDFFTDLKLWKERSAFGKIHEGFYNYVNATSTVVTAHLARTIGDDSKPIVLTGHSLGAAAAVIQAAYLHQSGFNVDSIYTFGEPRIGDHQFKEYIDAAFHHCHFRHVNGMDGVPWAPFWLMGFRHSGQRFYFSTNHQVLIRNAPLCQTVLERLPIFLKKPWKWVLNKKFDHSVFNYVSACQRNI